MSRALRPAATTVFLVAPLLGPGGCDRRVDPRHHADPPPATSSGIERVHEDRILQTRSPAVDVLWVIDNSSSGVEGQASLAAAAPRFFEHLLDSGIDYHVGVVTTDLDGTYPGAAGTLTSVGGRTFVDPATPDPVPTFLSLADVGAGGSATEQGMGAVYEALQVGANQGFWRDEAALHTIVVSDEPDFTRDTVVTQDAFVRWYDRLKSDERDRTFSEIVGPYGGRYRLITMEVGGLDASSDDDWGEVLDRFGHQVEGLRTEFFLSRLPVERTLRVEVEDGGTTGAFERGVDYTYDPDRNSVTFLGDAPGAFSTVVLTYRVREETVPTTP